MKLYFTLSLLVVAATANDIPIKRKEVEFDSRITNGDLAAPGQLPYQVGLNLAYGSGNGGWCGGSLIAPRWILTAAHCVHNVKSVMVYLGATNIKNNGNGQLGQQQIYADEFIVHKKWNPVAATNDIALIQLSTAAEYSDFIQPILLPKKTGQYSNYVGNKVVASGWGKESDSDKYVSENLHYFEGTVLKRTTCTEFYFGVFTSKQLCVSTKGGKSTCNGDSGGPLVYQEEGTASRYLIGITSLGLSVGCEIGWPAVFTRVTPYLDWIEEFSGVVNK